MSSTSTPKKPPAPSVNPRKTATTPAATNPASGPSPSRMAAQTTTTTSGNTTSGVNRTRSVRNGAPLSARAAARKPAESDAAAEEIRLEMQAHLDELRDRLQRTEHAFEESQKQATVLQLKLDEASKEQGILEESVHEHAERIEELDNEKKESLRARRELEQIYEAERAAAIKEREEAQAREDEMQNALHRMKESLAQREMRVGLDDDRRSSLSRTGSFRRESTASPTHDYGGQFAPPSSVQRSESRSSSKLVMQKDKIIEGLRMELAEAQIKLVEVENLGGGHLQELQKQVYETKIQNARLMEENESFQLLLSEKTLNGDFANSDLLRAPSNGGSRPSSRHPHAGGASLADELAGQSDGEGNENERRWLGEANSLRDQNKALTLYINNIISRLLQHEQFEQILDKTPDLMAGPGAAIRRYAETNSDVPPPPPPKDIKDGEEQEHPAGFLERARSVIGAKPKRPVSYIHSTQPAHSSAEGTKVNENPDTAPRIPLARSNSSRDRGHRRANSDWPAASVVTSMYRGPSGGFQGPVSPGLTSPTGRGSFFASSQPLGGMQRLPSSTGSASSSAVPTIPETEQNKENASTARDSKVGNATMDSRNSLTSTPQNIEIDQQESGLSDLSNPSSPPRSTTSSGDRDARSGGAVMIGSKMRPLRLVQEATEQDTAARKAANRGSWFGWMNKGVAGGAPTGGRSVSGDGSGV